MERFKKVLKICGILFLAVVLLSAVGFAYVLFGIDADQTFLRAVIYGIVMVLLFLVSFCVQQRWVFNASKEGKNNAE